MRQKATLSIVIKTAVLFIAVLPLKAEIETYPLPPQAFELSQSFKINANGKKVPVFIFFGEGKKILYHHSHFSFSGKVKVDIELPTTINNALILPRTRHIKTRISDNSVSFELSDPGYFLVRINQHHDLLILADPIDNDKPDIKNSNRVLNIKDLVKKSDGAQVQTVELQNAIDLAAREKKTLYFGPGIYRTGNLGLRESSDIYLAGGAVIQASDNPRDHKNFGRDGKLITGWNVSNIKIRGRGIIDANAVKLIEHYNSNSKHKLDSHKIVIRPLYFNSPKTETKRTKNITISGIILTGSSEWHTPVYKSENLKISRLKILGNTDWHRTDGISVCSTRNATISDCFVYTGDDGYTAYGTHEGFEVSNVKFERVTSFSTCASFRVGWLTRALASDIVFEECYALAGGRAIAVEGNIGKGIVQKVTFKKIYIDDPKHMIFRVRVQEENIVKNILLEDIVSYIPRKSFIETFDKAGIENINIRNISFDMGKKGKRLTPDMIIARGNVKSAALDGVLLKIEPGIPLPEKAQERQKRVRREWELQRKQNSRNK